MLFIFFIQISVIILNIIIRFYFWCIKADMTSAPMTTPTVTAAITKYWKSTWLKKHNAVFYSQTKSSEARENFPLDASSTTPLCSAVAFLGRISPTQWVGACLVPHPAALHTSQGRSIMVCLMQGETSIIRAEAETTVESTKERGRADAGHNRLCCRLAPLI